MKLNVVYSFLSFGIFIIKVTGSTLINGIIIVLNENLSLNIKTLTSEYIIVILSTTRILNLFCLVIFIFFKLNYPTSQSTNISVTALAEFPNPPVSAPIAPSAAQPDIVPITGIIAVAPMPP